jgi:type I restriction enzyme S subunit
MRTTTFRDVLLEEIAEIKSGVGFPISMQGCESGDFPFAKVGDISNRARSGEQFISDAPNWVKNEDLSTLKFTPFPTGTIVFAKIGEAIRQNFRAVSTRPMLFDNNVMGVIPQEERVDTTYLYFYLRTLDFYHLAGKTTVPAIRKSTIEKLKIPLPPLEEQRRIAAILDKADGVRRKRKEAIRLTEELLKSTFLEMFGDPVTNPKGWEIKKLEEVTTKITDGVHSRPNYTEQGVPFISVKDITTGELKFDDCKFISEEDHKKYKKRCNPDMGDILYTKVGATYGRPALVNVKSEFSLYVSVCLIKPQRDLIFPEFLKEALATPALKSQADRSIKGIGVPDLHLNMIKDFIVPVPPIYKQKEFLEIASKIQFSKESLTSCSQESENLFNSLLQRAFRGEL